MTEIFNKPALPIEEQIALLKKRGLIIKDEQKAENALRYIGYYHLSAYMLPFQMADQTDHHHFFLNKTSFDEILNIYDFDRNLRLLVMDAVERIEVAIKAALINEMSSPYDPHWYTNPDYFIPAFDHTRLLQHIQKDIQYGQPINKVNNICLNHYYKTYSQPSMPPCWMTFEALSFSTISILFNGINLSDRRRIASVLCLPPQVLTSWLHSLSYARNICAHHQRLWNRVLTVKPLVPTDRTLRDVAAEMNPNTKFYAQAALIHKTLSIISPETVWKEKLTELIKRYPNLPLNKMGFTKGWDKKDFWKS